MMFTPADRPDRFEKATHRADVIILDLEDGASQELHDEARHNIEQSNLDPARTVVRVCSPDLPEFEEDIACVRRTQYTTVMIPKVDGPTPDVGLHVIATLETPAAVLRAREIAHGPGVVGLFWGAEDYTAELGGIYSRLQTDERGWEGYHGSAEGPYRPIVAHLRMTTLLHAAEAGIVAIDAVHADFSDDSGLRDEALDAARIGFAATAVIHPRQVPVVREAYRPTPDQVAMARRIVEATTTDTGRTHGAIKVDGKMVDAPLFRQAQILAARADALGL